MNLKILNRFLEKFPVNKDAITLDMDGRSYLHHAVTNSMADVMMCLLEQGYDCNKQD